jgi:ubiquinone/menaquinone biosynthesis C-methylase UbiE
MSHPPHAGLADAYAAAAPMWASAPDRVYQVLAETLVGAAPEALAGRRVVDVGAGTGTVTRALLHRGATVVALDLVVEMLAQLRARMRSEVQADGFAPRRASVAAADATALPIATDGVEAAVAAFVLNHLPEPTAALREIARAVRPGGLVLASTFAQQPRHGVKVAVETAAASFGYREPSWYTTLKQEVEPRTAGAERLAAVAGAAGLVAIEAREQTVEVGVDTPEAIVAYRLGMAHLAPFVAGLDDDGRAALRTAALAALGPEVEPFRPVVVLLTARSA